MRKLTTTLSLVLALQYSLAASAQSINDSARDAKVQRNGNTVTISANSPRPLQQVIDAVAEEYGWSIDYEDPPYQSSFDLADDTDPKWRAAHPKSRGVTRVRGGVFDASFTETPSTGVSQKNKEGVLNKIVADYNSSGNPGKFAVRQAKDGQLLIVGTGVKGEGGESIAVASVLDTMVTLPAASMTAARAVSAILDAVNANSKTKVLPATTPTNLMVQTIVKTPGTEMPAREALRHVLSQASIELSWRLLYDADSQTYYLNILLARRAHYDMFGNRQLVLIRKH